MTRLLLLALGLVACGGPSGGAAAPAPPPHRVSGLPPLLADVTPAVAPGGDPDGEADGEVGLDADLAGWVSARGARFVAAEAPPATAHAHVCDLRGLAGAVFVAHSALAIDRDGARVHRYAPAAAAGTRWSLAFDWDRGGRAGETHEVGGQGFARARVIEGRLWVTDADAPRFGGFGLADAPFEDYLFVSDERGGFAPLGPGDAPPAGTRLLPFAFHAFDVIPFRGALVATGGTLAPGGSVHGRGGYPGGLFVGEPDDAELAPRWTVGGTRAGVVRTTYAHRFGGRLYVGVQNNERRARLDLAVLGGDPRTTAPLEVRVTDDGGWLTRRFASAGGVLWWVASGYPRDGRGGALFRSRDGLRFERIALPEGAGDPQDVVTLGEGRVLVLTTTGLYRGAGAAAGVELVRLADAPAGDPFGAWDTFCSAPLERAAGAIWAGGTRDGGLWRVEPVP